MSNRAQARRRWRESWKSYTYKAHELSESTRQQRRQAWKDSWSRYFSHRRPG